jgi:hypothetical protein
VRYFLRRLGIDALVRIGVQPYGFRAHAWVEVAGRPINDVREQVAKFAPLPMVL